MTRGSLFKELGLPEPAEVLKIVQEIRRLNGNIESVQGDIQTLARYAPTLTTLAKVLQELHPDDIRTLATALANAQIPRATAVGERALTFAEGLYNKIIS